MRIAKGARCYPIHPSSRVPSEPEQQRLEASFALRAVAEDEPFGPEWQPMDTVDAADLWRAVLAEQAPASVAAALDTMAAAWGLTLARRLIAG